MSNIYHEISTSTQSDLRVDTTSPKKTTPLLSRDELEQGRPYTSNGERPEHADHTQRLLEILRDRAGAGITTGELIRKGDCGLRPPNRVKNLRDAGHLIETRREGRGVFRFILIRECANPTERRHSKKKAVQQPLRSDWITKRATTDERGRPIQEKREDCPLFAEVSR